MDNRPIGIMDSGSGGLSVYVALQKEMPNEHFIYIGDHRFIPYSTKSPMLIRKRVVSIIRNFIAMGVKCVVIACNTSTVVGIDEYRKRFPDIPIIGIVPVIKTGAELSQTKNIAVISTEVTSKSEYLGNLIKTFAKGINVKSIGNSSIVSLIESPQPQTVNLIEKEIQSIKKRINKDNIDVIALGCTHFPLVRDIFIRVFGENVAIIDSGMAVARHVHHVCEHNDIMSSGKVTDDQFFSTGNTRKVSETFSSILDKPTVVRSISIA